MLTVMEVNAFNPTWTGGGGDSVLITCCDHLSEDFFEVLHISVGPKIKILENCPDFLNFSAKTHNRL